MNSLCKDFLAAVAFLGFVTFSSSIEERIEKALPLADNAPASFYEIRREP